MLPTQFADPSLAMGGLAPEGVMMDARTRHVVRSFVDRLRSGFVIREAIVFGSFARNQATRASDTDVAIIIGGPRRDRGEASATMAGLAFDLLMETGVLIDPLPLWEDEYDVPETSSNPRLVRTIRKQGIVV